MRALPSDVFKLAAATRAARVHDPRIATRANAGAIDIVRVSFKRSGTSDVEVIRAGLTLAEAIDHMQAMGA